MDFLLDQAEAMSCGMLEIKQKITKKVQKNTANGVLWSPSAIDFAYYFLEKGVIQVPGQYGASPYKALIHDVVLESLKMQRSFVGDDLVMRYINLANTMAYMFGAEDVDGFAGFKFVPTRNGQAVIDTCHSFMRQVHGSNGLLLDHWATVVPFGCQYMFNIEIVFRDEL
jgi:hypothetical protein